MTTMLNGVYRALCLEVSEDRVRCNVPQIFADEVVTCFDVAGPRPAVGVEGWVAFIGGWPDQPVWMGGQWEAAAAGGGGTGVTDHGALTGLGDDDHPQYLTQAEGDTLFLKPTEVVAGTNVTVDRTAVPGSVIITSTGGGGGITDHGALAGLADDDHPQYLTSAEADALFLTQAEGDALFLTQAEGDALFLKPTEVVAGTNVTVDRTTTPGSVIISSSGGGTTPPNEVVVSATDPIGTYPEAELWFDPDAAAPIITFPGYGTVPAETTFGVARADGVATTVARSDHTHGSPTHNAAAHTSIPLSTFAAPTAPVSMGGNVVTNVAAPSAGTDAANRAYVDGAVAGVAPGGAGGYTLEERATLTTVPISGTAAETTIISPTFNAIVIGERIKFRAWGDLNNASGAAVNLRLFLRFSSLTGTLIFDTANNAIPVPSPLTNRHPWTFELEIEATTPATSNDFLGKLFIGAQSVSTRIGTNFVNATGVNPDVALDLSAPFQLFLTGQWASGTSTDLRLHGYSIERFVA